MNTSKFKNIAGSRIRQARRLQEPPLSQKDLARRVTRRGVNLDQGTISRIENRTRNVSDYELLAIARCLKVSIGFLCGEARSSVV